MWLYLYSSLGDNERPQYLAAALRGVFSYHFAVVGVAKNLPHLPDPSGSPTFASDLIGYSQNEEWMEYMKNTVS